MSKFDELDAVEMVKSEWMQAAALKEALSLGDEKEYTAASAVEQAMWDLWGKMLTAAEKAVLSNFPR